MTGDRRKHAFLLLAFGVTGACQPASAAEFLCRHGDLLRRVEVVAGEAVPDAACEVRYWRDASTSTEGEVLWRANQDLDFCDSRARNLLARLETGGWSCAASDPSGEPERSPQAAAPSAPRESPPSVAAPDPAPPQAPPEEPAPTTARAEPAQAEQPAAGAANVAEPSAPIEQPPDAAAEPSAPIGEPSTPVEQPAPTTTAEAEPPASITEPAAGPLPRIEPPAPAEQPAASAAGDPAADRFSTADPPAGNPNAPLLDRVVGQTLRSVQEMYGGDFRAEDTAFGDLDGDGRDDAAVLVTYQAEREDYVQYLVAYLFDGETFQSTATKNVGGRFLDALRADVRGIVDRAIVLDLQALDAGEACCETRRAAFVLREGQLVEVKDPAGAPGGRT